MRVWLAGLAVLVLLAAPAAGAGALLAADVTVFEGTLSAVVYNQTVTIPANGSLAIQIQPPAGAVSDWDYLVVLVDGNATVSLAATRNGSTVYKGTVTPLAAGAAAVTMPVADTVTLNAEQGWSGTVTVVIGANVAFEVTLEKSTVQLIDEGDTDTVGFTVRQTDGPPVYVWWTIENPVLEYLTVSDDMGVQHTDGEGWSRDGTFTFKLREKPAEEKRASVSLKLYYDTEYGEDGVLAAVVTFDGILDPVKAALGAEDGDVPWGLIGVGVVVAFVVFAAFFGGKR